MKRLIILVLILFLSSVCNGDTYNVNPATADSFLNQGAQTTPYGGSTWMEVASASGSNNTRSILKFDFTGLDDTAVISAATLSVFCYAKPNSDPVGRTYWAYRITQSAWVEAQVTWNIYSTSNNWTAAGGDYTATDGASITVPAGINVWHEWNVTTLVQDAQSSRSEILHVLLRDGTEDSGTWYNSTYYSKENASANKPKLAITYTIPSSSFVPKIMIIQ